MSGRIQATAVLAGVIVAGLWSMTAAGPATGGTTGKLSGRVLDTKKQPIEVVTVTLVGTRLGAYTKADGSFSILNVPAGTYEVAFSRMGFEGKRVRNVVVSSDETTRLDAELRETSLTAEEVVVTAERPPVDISVTSTKATLTAEDIESLPVQNLEDVVNLQAGVVDGHFRGGRQGEVQYQVDGVSMNNAYSNKPLLQLDRSLLQEVQVISGTFDAEYGQAMSGVVNAVLKQGTAKFRWDGEVYSGGYVFPGNGERLTDDTVRPAALQSYQLTVSGPLPLPATVFLLSGRRYVSDDYIRGERRFVPADSSDFQHADFRGTGDGASVPLGFSREWSGVAKLTNSSFTNTKLNYQATVNYSEGRRANFAYRYNPDGQTQQENLGLSHGLDWTQTLDKDTYLNLSLRQNYLRYTDYAFEDLYDPRYDEAGRSMSSDEYERGAIIEGYDFGRFKQTTNAFLVKTSLTSQVTAEHLIKVGAELEFPNVEFGAPGHLTYRPVGGVNQLVRFLDAALEGYPGARSYHPLMGAAFVQDQAEWQDLTVRAGFRFDYMDAQAELPGDLANPANAIPGAPAPPPVPTSKKIAISPRLGVAYPIEDKAAVHVAYGHFRQFPSVDDMFRNADYSVLYNLQAGVQQPVFGNPDVEPEKTVQYEIGYKHALSDDFGADLTVFYKDIRDLLGVEFIESYNDAQYPRLTNVDFGNVFGITLALDHRRLGPASVSLDYTWQQATGNSSDPRETATRASAGEDPRPRLIPLNWDQRHTLNMTVAVSRPENYSVSAVLKVASGQPYTPVLESGFGQGLGTNSGRKPTGILLDLRAEKPLPRIARSFTAFARIFNVFDTRFFNGAVYESTGSPYYSRFPESDWIALRDPSRFYAPRRIELGFRFGMGGS